MSANSLFKRFFKTRHFRAFACWVIATYIRLVYYTSLKHMEMDEAAKPYVYGELPAVFAFWHGRLMMMAMRNPSKRKMHVLVSSHRDGEMLSRTMLHFGVESVRGSTSRGGAAGALNAVKVLQAGGNVSVTPDGPRGPAMVLQPGILTIAELAKAPIIPVTYTSTRHKRMRSWDSFIVALPFGKIYYKVGAPMINPTQKALEAIMIKITQEVDSK